MSKRKRVSGRISASKKLNTENPQISLETYSQSLIDTALEARKKYKEDYRNEIQQLREQLSVTRESEVVALNVFPEEIWNIILGNIKIPEELQKCVKADPLFRRIVSNTQVLFGEVFTFLSAYLNKQDILACSHVCSKWRYGVHLFLSHYHGGIQENVPDSLFRKCRKLNSFQTELNFASDYLNPNVNAMPHSEPMLLPGGVVTIRKFWRPSPLQMPKFDEWFNSNGEKVLHVTLAMKINLVNLQQVYQICSKLANTCPNLKSLHLLGGVGNPKPETSRVLLSKWMPLKFPKLESVTSTIQCDILLEIQHLLLKSFSSQLKHLSVSCWNTDKYNQLPWNNLRQLEILKTNALQVLRDLENLPVPNLLKLQIRLDSKCQDLTQLFRTINHFSNLQSLSLTLTENFSEVSERELIKLPLEILTCNKISTLEMVTKSQKPNRDFLLYFPFVRNLILRFGKAAAKSNEFEESNAEDSSIFEDASNYESSEDEFQRRRNMERVGRVLPSGARVPAQKPAPKQNPARIPEFIDVNKFGKCESLKNYYKSNIWKVMPFLSKMELQCVTTQPFRYRGMRPRKRFTNVINLTKEGCVWETKERELRQQIHLDKVLKEARLQIRERRDAMVKELSKPKVALKQGRKATRLEKQRKKLVQEKALSLVMKMMTKPQILECRLVSKTWYNLADKQFLQDELLARDCVLRKKYSNRNYRVESDDSEDSEDQLKENFENLFFARIVEAKLEDVSYAVEEDLISTIENLGENIDHLSIGSDSQVDVDDLYNICAAVVGSCPNLQSFSFSFTNLQNSRWSEEDAAKRHLKTLEMHQSLESITIIGPRQSRNTCFLNPNMFGRIQGYSNLLTQFAKFPNLKHLKFGAAFTEKWIGILEKFLEAPGLEKLGLRLGGDHVTIEQLIKLINKFPKLTDLELEFYRRLGGLSNKGVVYTSPTCISTRVTNVKLTMEKEEEVSLDFLIHFPFLRKLYITYGPWAAPWDKKDQDDDQDSDIDFDSETETWKTEEFVSFQEPDNDYIQLVKYLGLRKPTMHFRNKILESNIWVALEKLGRLELTCVLTKKGKKHTTVLTRQER